MDKELLLHQLKSFLLLALCFNALLSDYNGYEPAAQTAHAKCQCTYQQMKLPSFNKKTPTLGPDNVAKWMYFVGVGIHNVGVNCGKLVLGGDIKQRSTDAMTADEKAEYEKEEADFKKTMEAYENSDEGRKELGHVYNELLNSVSDEDQDLLMAVPYPDARRAYKALVDKYRVNTRGARSRMFKDFINIEMGEDESFRAFVTRLNAEASKINGMQNSEITVTDPLKQVALLEGVQENHARGHVRCGAPDDGAGGKDHLPRLRYSHGNGRQPDGALCGRESCQGQSCKCQEDQGGP